jgi:hypothetical protein
MTGTQSVSRGAGAGFSRKESLFIGWIKGMESFPRG